MNYNNPIPSTFSLVIRLSSIVLFALFSFLYLFCLQCDVLAEAQYVFSGGVTSYSRLWGALIITAILLAVQGVVAKYTQLTG